MYCGSVTIHMVEDIYKHRLHVLGLLFNRRFGGSKKIWSSCVYQPVSHEDLDKILLFPI
jgi:hypothetical protein